MIKSVKFPNEGKGYLYKKYEKPEKPMKHKYSRIPYAQLMEEYKEDMKVYRANKGKFVVHAAYNLAGKEFRFEDGKVNVLFGPNASGKTTILKAIAGNAMIDDGFTCFREPLEFGFLEKHTVDEVVETLRKNSSEVEWDGIPIYYDNFALRKEQSNGFGELTGSFIEDTRDEILYHLSSRKMSAGQNTVYILNRIFEIASRLVSLKDICEKQYMYFKSGNNTWKDCARTQMEYFSKLPRYAEQSNPTLIFDEIDKSLDIETVWDMYSRFLPEIARMYGCQIILVSHNPLILSRNIMENDMYNIVSIDEDYTTDVVKTLKTVTF